MALGFGTESGRDWLERGPHIGRLSPSEIGHMLRDNAWKMVKRDSEAEVQEHSKLCGKGSVGI